MIRIFIFLLIAACVSCEQKPLNKSNIPTANEHFNDDNRDRAAWQKPSLVINKLGDLTGKTVADIGAGTGYFAFRLAFKAQKVIAVEIDQSLIDLMNGIKINLPAEMQTHFETRLAGPDDANLNDEEADVVVVINTINYIDQKEAYLKSLYKGMKRGGKILVLDYKVINIPLEDIPALEERLPADELGLALAKAGFMDIDIDKKSLDYQYMVMASKT
jgi:ubiquinone/menaquinone biosynthesis C-methylase UbiE